MLPCPFCPQSQSETLFGGSLNEAFLHGAIAAVPSPSLLLELSSPRPRHFNNLTSASATRTTCRSSSNKSAIRQQNERIWRRLALKSIIVRNLIEGRITVSKAADQFVALNQTG